MTLAQRKVANRTRSTDLRQEKATIGHADSVVSGQRCRDSTGGKKAGVCASGTDPQAHAPGTFGTIPLVGRGLPVDVNPRVHVAADKMDADKAPAARRRFLAAGTRAWHIIRQVEVFTDHGINRTNQRLIRTLPGGWGCFTRINHGDSSRWRDSFGRQNGAACGGTESLGHISDTP
jgi:hypothetical protein